MQNDTTLRPGTKLGEYEIVEPIGAGGMATVYKAIQYVHNDKRYVAIKVLDINKLKANRDEFEKRFVREARTLARLEHPYILRIYGSSRTSNYYWIAMQYISHGTLHDELVRSKGNPMHLERIHALMSPICKALEHAHQNKVVHRDLKPANILIDESGIPYISDFGIARIVSDSTSSGMTSVGVSMGTLDYMAPEQMISARDVDQRADIYALGIITLQMLTGQRPKRSTNVTVPVDVATPLQALGYDDALIDTLEQSVALSQDDRFSTVGEYLQAFNDAVNPHIYSEYVTNPTRYRSKSNEPDEFDDESTLPVTEDSQPSRPASPYQTGNLNINNLPDHTPPPSAPRPNKSDDGILIHENSRPRRPAAPPPYQPYGSGATPGPINTGNMGGVYGGGGGYVPQPNTPYPPQPNTPYPPQPNTPYPPSDTDIASDSSLPYKPPSYVDLDTIQKDFLLDADLSQIVAPHICPVCLADANHEVKVAVGGAPFTYATVYFCGRHGGRYHSYSPLFYAAHAIMVALVIFMMFVLQVPGLVGGIVLYAIVWRFLDTLRPIKTQEARGAIRVRKKQGKVNIITVSRRYAHAFREHNNSYLAN